MKALVAMSGGVDSSVAAYLLMKQGFEVIGLSFELWDQRDRKDRNICCSVETIEIAREVAHKIGVQHLTVDVRDTFYRYIIEEFCSSYIEGRTPNPCILCNKFVKFKVLLDKAEEIGAELVATGHYARIEKPRRPVSPGAGHFYNNSRVLLKKGADPRKDQSYVLYVMSQEELSKTVFPLGDLKKHQTREIAGRLGLVNALRPESQEICFIGEGNYVDFIMSLDPKALNPGPIADTGGKIIGEHKGIAFYTIGQRKRLGIQSVKPYYVTHIDRQSNTVVVGLKEEAMRKIFKVKELNWIARSSLAVPMKVMVKIRSTMPERGAVIIPDKNQNVTIEFDEPQWAPASGQSAVFYSGDIVIGGGVIE